MKKSVLKFVQQHVPDMTEEGLINTIAKGGEGLRSDSKSKRWWTLDPIDGTMGYVNQSKLNESEGGGR